MGIYFKESISFILIAMFSLSGCGNQFTEADLNGEWTEVYAKGTVGQEGSSTGSIYTFNFHGSSGTIAMSGWITGPANATVTTIAPGSKYEIKWQTSSGEWQSIDITVENKNRLLAEENWGGGMKPRSNLIRK